MPELCDATDIWTDQMQRSFMVLFVRFVDKKFYLDNYVLEVCAFPGMHTGLRIADRLRTTMEDWRLLKDPCTKLVRDGASNGVLAGNELSIDRISCFAYGFHLIVQSGMVRPLKVNAVRQPAPQTRGTADGWEGSDDVSEDGLQELQESSTVEVDAIVREQAQRMKNGSSRDASHGASLPCCGKVFQALAERKRQTADVP